MWLVHCLAVFAAVAYGLMALALTIFLIKDGWDIGIGLLAVCLILAALLMLYIKGVA